MILRLSRYVHLLPVGEDRVLVLHAVNQLRLVVDKELGDLIALFAQPRDVVDGAFDALIERGVLTDKSPEQEQEALTGELTAHHGHGRAPASSGQGRRPRLLGHRTGAERRRYAGRAT
jgi:hypothetical protein